MIGGPVFVAMLAIGSLLADAPVFHVTPPTPAPSPTPDLPQIGHVRALSGLCTMLRDTVGPTIGGMEKNDELVSASHRAYAKMSDDSALGNTAAMQLDRNYLGEVETRLVRNLASIDSVIKKAPNDTPDVAPVDKPTQQALTAQLAAVAASQRNALNLLAGVLDTEALGEMQSEFDTNLKNSNTPTVGTGKTSTLTTAPTDSPGSYLGAAGLPQYSQNSALPNLNSKTSSLKGHTVYDAIQENLDGIQAVTIRRERIAAATVAAAIDDCKARLDQQATPSPVPAPVPSPLPTH